MGVYAGSDDPEAMQTAALETELEDLYHQMRRLDAQYTGSRTVEPIALDETQQRLPANAALLEYFAAGEEIGCFVVTNTEVHGRLLPDAAALLHRHLVAGELAPGLGLFHGQDGEDATTAVADLSDALLTPIEEMLAAYTDLYVVPHDLLHYVPLHALGRRTPLLEHHRVTYAPSATVLLGSPESQGARAGATRSGCLALGYDGMDLLYAEREARHVAALTGGAAYLGADATQAVLFGEGPAYRTLHLACHGTFNAEAPLASGLLLADGKVDAMSILQGLRLRADLVVLSACDTGQAAVLRGDELLGLTRALLYAGAAEVLVSLWPVDDLATVLLMDSFYRARSAQPAGSLGAAEPLRQAQRELRSLSVSDILATCARLGLPADVSASHAGAPQLVGMARDSPMLARRRAAGTKAAADPMPAADTQRRAGATAGEDVPQAEAARASRNNATDRSHYHPYDQPYYWAAFTVVRGTAPDPGR
jgi:CHAT domain-containing protein